MNWKSPISFAVLAVFTATPMFAAYQEEVDFLRKHTPIVELGSGDCRVAIAPAWQGRVMTSTATGVGGGSFGWINPPTIEAGIKPEAEREGLAKHIHIFGGEERLWFGPEGGPFSLFFQPGAKQVFEQWRTPAAIDTEPFEVIGKPSETEAVFGRSMALRNRAGTTLSMDVRRTVRLLKPEDVSALCEACLPKNLKMVGYATDNRVTNTGKAAWTRETGAPSIWMLGMYKPSPKTTVVIPIEAGGVDKLGKKVETSYFGEVPADRIKIGENVVYFKGDGGHRSKIGVSPKRSQGIAGSWSPDSNTLTLVIIGSNLAAQDTGWPYVDSQWRDDVNPFGGDVINSYNDGAPEPGAKPLGPFYELETSSPALLLGPQESFTHTQATLHLTGEREALDSVAVKLLGVSLNEIEGGL